MPDRSSTADEIFAIFTERGASAYLGERVSMTEHALQTAYFARQDAARAELIVAALLHDIGHLVEPVPGDIADWRKDARHEEIGSRWIARRLPAAVSEPVRLHVPAKRYLCATDEHYVDKLSPASVVTLKLQGGPMSPAEMAQFESERHCEDAVRIRRWDDQGKIAGLRIPGLAEYRDLIEQVAASASRAGD